MSRPRDRASGWGLLPRMEARPWKDGVTVTYRYHQVDGPPINLGTDKQAALRKVLDLTGGNSDLGTMNELWRLYQGSTDWARLSPASQADYTQSSKQLLKVFGAVAPGVIQPPMLARYLRVERASSPVRANREMALMSNLLNLAVERGDIAANPCKQIRRNHEAPRRNAPDVEALAAFLAWTQQRPGQAQILAGMAEFAALTGNRRVEFLRLHWPQVGDVVRLIRAKQRGRQTVEVVTVSEALQALFDRLRPLAKDDRMGAVFPTRGGNPYTDAGFKAMWSKLMKAALEEKIVAKRFTFHDLRSYFVTQHKVRHGHLPDLHSDPGTTARVYDSTKEVSRRSL